MKLGCLRECLPARGPAAGSGGAAPAAEAPKIEELVEDDDETGLEGKDIELIMSQVTA